MKKALAIILAGLALGACAGEDPAQSRLEPATGSLQPAPMDAVKKLEIVVPETTQGLIAIDEKGRPIVFDGGGAPVKPCFLCNPEREEKFGKGCAEGIESGEICPVPDKKPLFSEPLKYYPPNSLICISIDAILWCYTWP